MFVLHCMSHISDQEPRAHCKHREKAASSGRFFDQTPCSLIVETNCLIVTNDLHSFRQMSLQGLQLLLVQLGISSGNWITQNIGQYWFPRTLQAPFILTLGEEDGTLISVDTGSVQQFFPKCGISTGEQCESWPLSDQFGMAPIDCWVHWIAVG